ncbi:hypothetical protein GCM10027089_09320 [Nocardia thraciensis]
MEHRRRQPGSGRGERIYYAGRANSKHYGPGSRYAIGVLERRGSEWVRRDAPVIVGDVRRRSVLEPSVVYADGCFRMWYLATPREIGPGERPDYELRYTQSEDGRDFSTTRSLGAPTCMAPLTSRNRGCGG